MKICRQLNGHITDISDIPVVFLLIHALNSFLQVLPETTELIHNENVSVTETHCGGHGELFPSKGDSKQLRLTV